MHILIFLFGAIIGSFLNVCIYRIPMEESIAYPKSYCPKCSTPLKWNDLIPVFSFLLRKGKCRYCGEKISLQYPAIELLSAIVYLVIYVKFRFLLEFFFYTIIFSLLIIVFFIDIQHMIIPDALIVFILGGTIIYKIISYLIYRQSTNLLSSIGGLFLSSLLFIIIIITSKGGMGGGDAKLIGSLGFILGIKQTFLTIFLSFILGAIVSIILLILNIKGKKDPIPFGPFIILGFSIVLFWGDKLINWYLNMLFI